MQENVSIRFYNDLVLVLQQLNAEYIFLLFFWTQGCLTMDSDLSPQDKKDLDKFIKFFALKVRNWGDAHSTLS